MGFGDDQSAIRRSRGIRLALPVHDCQTAGKRPQELRGRCEQTAGMGSGGVVGGTRVDVVA